MIDVDIYIFHFRTCAIKPLPPVIYSFCIVDYTVLTCKSEKMAHRVKYLLMILLGMIRLG